jgi:hypothetical protein
MIDDLEALIQDHMRRHPGFRVQDLYKLLHQSVFGPGHLRAGSDGYIMELRSELGDLGDPLRNEPLLECIHPEEEAFRVNLRPFSRTGLSAEYLSRTVMESVPLFGGHRQEFLDLWDGSRALAESGRIEIPLGALRGLEREVDWALLPPLHHSERYRRLNRPRYRVIHRELIGHLGLSGV